MVGYGTASTTERVLVDNDGLAIQSLLKIQSAQWGNSLDQAFDGDEMNIFAPQSIQSAIELEKKAAVQRQIIYPGTSVPIIGVVQDSLLGSYNLTQPSTRVDWHDAMNILSYTTIDKFADFKKKDMRGTELFSMIIPRKISTTRKGFELKRGELDPEKGVMNKSLLGSKKANSMIHLIWDEYGVDETRQFLDNIQRLINNFNLRNGFSVGIGDIDINKELIKEMENMIETKKLEVNHLITELENNPDLMDNDLFELSVFSELNAISEEVSKLIIQNMDKDNNFYIMAIGSGSKGSPSNIGQMGGCIGQTAIEGKRARKRLNGRTLPYFHQNDDSAVGKGFIESSFIDGLQPTEFIFHNMGSREGLIDTAIKSVTGDTPIIVCENGETKRVLIGDWIDNKLSNNKDKVEHHKERDMELLKIDDSITIPTCDNDGNVTWGKITAITRHDPGKELYKITTEGGRSVIVTESKSLLIWNNTIKKFEKMDTPHVVIGDYVPVTVNLPNTCSQITSTQPIDQLNIKVVERDLTELFKLYHRETSKKCSNYDCNTIYIANGEEDRDAYIALAGRLNIPVKIDDRSVMKFGKNDIINIINNVMLDKIIKIEKIDVSLYPKVYDLTIPSTLNFGLANGLHVVDTAESGYIQRKLIKTMEDISIKYDGTVRNSNDTLLQFIYGDSGIDTTKQFKHSLESVMLDDVEFDKMFKFTKDELTKLDVSESENNNYVSQLKQLRDQIRTSQMKVTLNYKIFNAEYMLPINFMRVIDNMRYENTDSKEKLSGKYVSSRLEDVIEYKNTMLACISKNSQKKEDSIKLRDERVSKTIFRYALHNFLAPKRVIVEYGFNKKQFDSIIEQIINGYNKAVIQPGEMVGVLAAQSIGEPVTQLTLNSLDWNEQIVVYENNTTKNVKIGEIIDTLMKTYSDKTEFIGDNEDKEMNDTYYLDTSCLDIFCPSVTAQGVTEWKRVTAVTKHLPRNKDGTDTLVKITTCSGRTVIATKAKSFLTRKNNLLVPTRGDELNQETYIPLILDLLDPIGKSFELDGVKQMDNIIPNIELSKGVFSGDKNTLRKLTFDNLLDPLDKTIIEGILSSNLYYDKIVTIEEVRPSNKYVYDLTVEDNRTFLKSNGVWVNDTFHSAGIGSKGTASLGVPRVRELLSFSRNMKTPVMEIYLSEKFKKSKDMANRIASHIKYTDMSSVRNRIDVYYDPTPYKKGGFMEQDNVYNLFHSHNPSKYSCQAEINNLPWLLRIELDKEKMMEKDLTLLDIKSKFCSFWEKRYQTTRSLKKDEKRLMEKVQQLAVLSNSDNDKTPILHIRFDMMNFDFSTIVRFTDIVIDSFKLKGIESIDDIYDVKKERVIVVDKKTNALNREEEYVIYTKGVNLVDIRYINGIDLQRTICNDVVSIYEEFGIEAARAVLAKEIKTIIKETNYQHLSILLDVMTSTGGLISVDRHGLNKVDTNPFARASFEKTIEQFINAAVHCEIDSMRSVSSRIMAGLVIKGGTGAMNLSMDTDMLEKSEFIEETVTYDKTDIAEITQDPVIKDTIEGDGKDEIFMPM